jgi:hypothetical protein
MFNPLTEIVIFVAVAKAVALEVPFPWVTKETAVNVAGALLLKAA